MVSPLPSFLVGSTLELPPTLPLNARRVGQTSACGDGECVAFVRLCTNYRSTHLYSHGIKFRTLSSTALRRS